MTKDLEWLKEEIDKLDTEESQRYPHWEAVWKVEVMKLIDQVEQADKPVIPQFVANELEDKKAGGQKLYSFMSTVLNRINHITDWKEWSEKNANWADIIARAWLDGYTVEEKKYYVVDNEYIPLLQKGHGYVNRTSTGLSIFEKGRDTDQFALTEQEIKDYDIRYWAFVEEVDS